MMALQNHVRAHFKIFRADASGKLISTFPHPALGRHWRGAAVWLKALRAPLPFPACETKPEMKRGIKAKSRCPLSPITLCPRMRLSRYFLPIFRETPKEAEIVSHRLMLRAGMIRQEAAGIYSWLPLGLRVLQKVAQIVREEMDRAGAIELLMPTLQLADLWRETGRYEAYGPEMLRIKDRHERELLYGPTNEDMITGDLSRLCAKLPGTAQNPLPHPVEIPRRAKAPLRRHARTRVPDEGRLFLRCRRGFRAAVLQ